MTTLVSVRGVSHRFGTHQALDNVSMQIDPGSYTVLLGPGWYHFLVNAVRDAPANADIT